MTKRMGSRSGTLPTAPIAIFLPSGWRSFTVVPSVKAYLRVGREATPPATTHVNGVTTIDSIGSPTGGTFRLGLFRGDVMTAALAHNASAANIKTALVNTGYVATGDVTEAGGPLPTAVTLTWQGSYAGTIPGIIVVSEVTPGAIRARETTVPLANGGYRIVPANHVETFRSDVGEWPDPAFLYLAAVSTAGTYDLSFM